MASNISLQTNVLYVITTGFFFFWERGNLFVLFFILKKNPTLWPQLDMQMFDYSFKYNTVSTHLELYTMLISCICIYQICLVHYHKYWVPSEDKTYYLIVIVWETSLLIALVSRVFANGPGNLGFNPRSCHTKDFKNGTWYLLA